AAFLALLPGKLDLGGHQRDPAQRDRRTHARPAPREQMNRTRTSLRTTGMHQRIFTFIAVAALALGLVACGSSSKKSSAPPASSGTASGTAQITIDSSFTFHVTPVKAGSTVTVRNDATV